MTAERSDTVPMPDEKEVREPAEIVLPGDEDLAEIGRLAAGMGEAPCDERARRVAQQGLLKDLTASFDRRPARESAAYPPRKVADLGAVLARFEQVATALGYSPPAGATSPPCGPELCLRDCRIDGCNLSYADVHWPVRLEHCVWPAPAEFVGANFHAPVNFLGCTFLREANFFAASFGAGVFFGGVNFHGVGDFRGATFHGEVNFFRANFRESLELRYATFERGAVLNLQELRFQGSTSLGGSLHLHLQQLRGGRWPRYTGRIIGERSPNPRDQADACEQYGELEANFAAQGSPDAASARDWCHYRYMDLRRRTRFGRWNPRRFLDWLFLKWCFGYGIITRRVLFTAVAVVFLFALAYATGGFGLSDDVWAVQYGSDADHRLLSQRPWPNRIANALYFSAVTFATVGYGDWHPLHWAKLAGAMEGMLGVFIMAVFTVSFARKLLR